LVILSVKKLPTNSESQIDRIFSSVKLWNLVVITTGLFWSTRWIRFIVDEDIDEPDYSLVLFFFTLPMLF
jgi:hypothetical protein